ncbi:MAG: chemotaxis response regulator protein-glutamate methylesterase [Myxococcales bacterium]
MVKVLVVDDSPLVRRTLEKIFGEDPELEVVGAAPNPFAARELILQKKPDVLTLDVEMPRMDGLTFLRKLMHYRPMPVVILSSLTPRGSEAAFEAMREGAVGVICKPGETYPLEQMGLELRASVKAAARSRPRRFRPAPPSAPTPASATLRAPSTARLVALGASTGGTVAIESILEAMPADAPAILVVQHMPPVFTESFAQRLDRLSAMAVREARDGDRVERGLALVAPGGKHLLVRRGPQGFVVRVKEGPLVSGHRPSVDVLFRSVAQEVGRGAVGALLTGMGADGARGLLELRQSGATTFAQDEESSVVFGMPKVAIELGAADHVVGLDRMAAALLNAS